jgi:hypothetical protein
MNVVPQINQYGFYLFIFWFKPPHCLQADKKQTLHKKSCMHKQLTPNQK